jgi:hypothetical protein
MNLVLLKNVSIVGLHWGAYHRKSSAAVLNCRPMLAFFLVHEPSHDTLVWKDLLAYVFSYATHPIGSRSS